MASRARVLLALFFASAFAPSALAKGAASTDCGSDPIAGTWFGKHHHRDIGDWYEHRLDIERVPGSKTEVIGTITVRAWEGNSRQTVPPSCKADEGGYLVVRMQATGHFVNGRLVFDGGDPETVMGRCGSSYAPYVADHFKGPLQKGRLELSNDDHWRPEHLIRFERRCGAVADNS